MLKRIILAFTEQQRNDFLNFLSSIDKTVGSKLPAKEAGDFLYLIVDYSVTDEEFELRIAKIFFKIPEMLNELRSSIKNLSAVRQAMLDEESANAEESREIALEFFTQRVDEYYELAFYEELEAEHELNAIEKKRRNDRKAEKRQFEKELQRLKAEQQIIFEIEKEERQKRKEQKQNVEKQIQDERQKEYDDGVKERKERQEKIEKEIASLQTKLQAQYEIESEERRKVREEKQAEQIERSKAQQEVQEQQAQKRQEEKEQEQMFMRARQAELQAEQERQIAIRLDKKHKEEQERIKVVRSIQESQQKERNNRKKQLLTTNPKLNLKKDG
ncbi:MAG: hypothetical protein PQ612_04175 [Rickettsiales bacterium]|nr:hypothetical protein [Pseudomonadota bacterium]MDA0966188.1 hypothetical protein [Pseudomonadota bacterium]MDG4543147.1 hypothetical protein [Rickettsiales bacterium]MDG4545345.1 hypothetical protein [Rickettsiales bacterium]MDG4547794.1 hypothetical protein [Rickettsiales bacterium]